MSAIESAPATAAPQPSRALVIGAGVPLVYMLFGMTWMGLVPVMPELTSSLGVERKDGTLLVTIISMAKSIVPILAGVLAARIGLTTTMRAAGVLILVGAAAPWLPDYAAVVAARFVFGIGGAIWVTLMGSVVMAALTPSQRPIANALNGVAVNLGVIVALFVTLPLSQSIGWQWAVSLASIASGVCLVALFAVGSLGPAPAKVSVAQLLLSYAKTLKLSTTWILAVAFCGPLALYLVMNTFLGTHLETFGVERAASMRWLSWLNLWGVPASLGAGFLLTKVYPQPRPYLLVASVLVPCAVACAVVVDSDVLRAVSFALVGFGMFLPVSPLITTVQKLPGQTPAQLGMVLGTMFAVTYVVSSAVPSAVGPLVDAGIPLGNVLMGAGLLGATPLAGLLLSTRR